MLRLSHFLYLIAYVILCSQSVNAQLDVLKEIEDAQLANQLKVKTWSGHATILAHTEPEDGHLDEEILLTFSMDREKNAYCFFWNTTKSMLMKDGVSSPYAKQDFQTGAMQFGEEYYRCFPYLRGQKNKMSVVIETPPKQTMNPSFAEHFDPKAMFNVGDNIGIRELMEERRQLATKTWMEQIISESDGIVTIRAKNIKLPEYYKEIVFDRSKAFNQISFTLGNLNAKFVIRQEYELVKDLWIPKRREVVTNDEAGKVTYLRKYEFTTTHLNVPLPEESFSLKAMGVIPGAIIHNDRGRVREVFQPRE